MELHIRPSVTDGKDVGGIFKSTSGGESWKKLTDGLPRQTGRIGLAVSASNPRVVMAVVQSYEGGTISIDELRSRSGGVFRSENGGEQWARVSAINPRPFYFSQIRVDPANDQRVYLLQYALFVSDDGGRNFREDLSDKVHPDCHAMVIQPGTVPPPKPPKPQGKEKPPKPPVCQRLLLGTDGGVYQSFAAGKGWEHLNRIPAGEFYRITLDNTKPYFRVAGGLQDNENWVGPSGVRSKEGIRNSDWVSLAGGDGFYVVFDPTDPDLFYAESQEGEVHRINLRNGELRQLQPEPHEGQPKYRFHWNSPLIGSVHNPRVIYLAGNHVFRLMERAEKFVVISPDLTRNEPARTTATGSGAENYGVIFSLAESPKRAGLLTSCRNGCEATPKLFASRRPGFSKAEIGGNPTPNSEHSRARAPTPKALTRALSALSPSSVRSCHLCRGFPARSIRDRCVELRKPLRSQQKIAQFRWASLSLQPVLARLRCVLAKIDSRYWVWRRAARASPFRI